MSPRKLRTSKRVMIAEQPMIGPESGGFQFCIVCDRSILRGDHWRKVWAADGSYAVGVHDRCHALAQADGAR
jgi:hypothetical protein